MISFPLGGQVHVQDASVKKSHGISGREFVFPQALTFMLSGHLRKCNRFSVFLDGRFFGAPNNLGHGYSDCLTTQEISNKFRLEAVRISKYF